MGIRIAGWLTKRFIGGCLVLILAAPTAKAAAAPWQEAAPARQEQSPPSLERRKPEPTAGTGSRCGFRAV